MLTFRNIMYSSPFRTTVCTLLFEVPPLCRARSVQATPKRLYHTSASYPALQTCSSNHSASFTQAMPLSKPIRMVSICICKANCNMSQNKPGNSIHVPQSTTSQQIQQSQLKQRYCCFCLRCQCILNKDKNSGRGWQIAVHFKAREFI